MITLRTKQPLTQIAPQGGARSMRWPIAGVAQYCDRISLQNILFSDENNHGAANQGDGA